MDINYNLIDVLQGLSQLENGKSNGHGLDDHVSGVILRSSMLCDLVNENPKKYKAIDAVDMEIVTAVAALHDIGNQIGRKFHNLYSAGIVRGDLSFEKCIEYNTNFPVSIRNECIAMINQSSQRVRTQNMEDKDRENFIKVLSDCLTESYAVKARFDLSFFGELQPPQSENERRLMTFFKNNVEFQDNTNGIPFNKDLQRISKELSLVFEDAPDKINTIAHACEEHNVDFWDKTNPRFHISGDIYSRIIFDADKDNVPETFAARSIAFASKFWTGKKPDIFLNKDKTLNKEEICKHILHQANERFRPSATEYELKTGKSGPMGWFEESLKYKNIKDVKGLYPKFLKAKEKNDFYLSSDAGDDLFSQLDYIAKDNAVAEFKENALNSFQFWADSDNEKESLQQIGKIFDEIEKIQKNKWIEQGNDEKDFRFTHIDSDVISQYTVEAEAAFYGMDVSDYNFDNIVEKVLIELKEKEIEKSEPQNLKELVSQIQQSRVVDEFEADVSDDAELEL